MGVFDPPSPLTLECPPDRLPHLREPLLGPLDVLHQANLEGCFRQSGGKGRRGHAHLTPFPPPHLTSHPGPLTQVSWYQCHPDSSMLCFWTTPSYNAHSVCMTLGLGLASWPVPSFGKWETSTELTGSLRTQCHSCHQCSHPQPSRWHRTGSSAQSFPALNS